MATIRLLRGTSGAWRRNNPKLDSGIQGYELDTGKFKIGNGLDSWVDLPYFVPENYVVEAIEYAISQIPPPTNTGGGTGVSTQELSVHINDPAPHPVYDDGPSLLLLYKNAKV